jgi:hypothetical protein
LKITPEMIEAAAQAIREQFGNRSQGGKRVRPWSAMPLALRQSYRAEALAALSAGLAVGQQNSAIITKAR